MGLTQTALLPADLMQMPPPENGRQTARIPDVAVILKNKIAELPDADVPIPFSPDLAVEVIFVSESARDAQKR